MIAGFIRFLLGLAMLPACWAASRTLYDSMVAAAAKSGGFSYESAALIGGMLVFSVCWMFAPHPVRAYVLGHELTHAIWGLLFGAVPSMLKVGVNSGSVKLTKTNVFITLAPYFFPFYTFVVILIALAVRFFVKPLPWLPLWTFLIGFTWAFHILFTFQSLTIRQPDVTAFGRVFSWTFIFIANVLVVLIWLIVATPLTFRGVGANFSMHCVGAYSGVWHFVQKIANISWLGIKSLVGS